MYTQADASQVHFFCRSQSTIFYGEHSINSSSNEFEAYSMKYFFIELIKFTARAILDGL